MLEEPEFSLVLVLAVLAFLVCLAQFLASEASQVGSIPDRRRGVSLRRSQEKGLTFCGFLSRGRGSRRCRRRRRC